MTIDTSSWKPVQFVNKDNNTLVYLADISDDLYLMLFYPKFHNLQYGPCEVKLIRQNPKTKDPLDVIFEQKFYTQQPYSPEVAQKTAVKLVLREAEKFITMWQQIDAATRKTFVKQDLLNPHKPNKESEENT